MTSFSEMCKAPTATSAAAAFHTINITNAILSHELLVGHNRMARTVSELDGWVLKRAQNVGDF